jgi:hypothetical protein
MTLPKVSMWSQFRDSAGEQIELYRKQIGQLDYPPELLRLYLNEGDSVDETVSELQAWAVEDERITVIKHDTGLARQFHTTRPERMRAVGETGNAAWERIAADAWGDYALMLESDLLYTPDLLRQLLRRKPPEASIFSPMIWITVNGVLRFYDVWAFRMGGKMFEPAAPAWYFARFGDQPFELESVGSVVLFDMEVITAGLRLTYDEAIVGLCGQARERGYRIFADPSIHILHPSIAGVA